MHITHALCSDGEQGTLSFLQSLDAKEKGRCTPSPPPTPPPRSPSPYLPPPPAGRISPTSPPSGRICSYQPPQGRTRLSASSVSSKHFDGGGKWGMYFPGKFGFSDTFWHILSPMEDCSPEPPSQQVVQPRGVYF